MLFQIDSDNTLVIRNIERDDIGTYKCHAANYVGRISAVALVKVNGKDLNINMFHSSCT